MQTQNLIWNKVKHVKQTWEEMDRPIDYIDLQENIRGNDLCKIVAVASSERWLTTFPNNPNLTVNRVREKKKQQKNDDTIDNPVL